MTASVTLPAGFQALEPFVARWSVATTSGRSALRSTSTPSERAAFYDAAAPLLPAALTYLDGRPLSSFDEAEQCLMRLMLSLVHVSLAIEIQGDVEEKHRELRERMRVTRSPADEEA